MFVTTVRPARAEDKTALQLLLDLSWRTHWAPHVEPASLLRYDRERPAFGYVEAYLDQFMVAERGGAVVGMYHLEGDYLHAIHAAVEAIGSGVGMALMAHAEAQGARKLEVRAFNSRARVFYEKRGWHGVAEYEGTEMGTPVRTILMERP